MLMNTTEYLIYSHSPVNSKYQSGLITTPEGNGLPFDLAKERPEENYELKEKLQFAKMYNLQNTINLPTFDKAKSYRSSNSLHQLRCMFQDHKLI